MTTLQVICQQECESGIGERYTYKGNKLISIVTTCEFHIRRVVASYCIYDRVSDCDDQFLILLKS